MELKLPCVLLSLDLPSAVEFRKEAGGTMSYQSAWEEIREVLIEYCIKLKTGNAKLPQNRVFNVHYNGTVVAQFGFYNGKHRKGPPVSSGVSD